jgi:ArsR family transcriptional regulator
MSASTSHVDRFRQIPFEALALHSLFEYSQNMEENEVVKALAALGQPVRLKVFRALVVAGRAGLTPGVLVETLGIPAATLSFHLKELTHAGLVSQERASRNLIYRADYRRMDGLLGYLTENCCQGQECLEPASARCDC